MAVKVLADIGIVASGAAFKTVSPRSFVGRWEYVLGATQKSIYPISLWGS